MPVYRFLDNETGEEWDDWMSNSDREKYLEENPNIQQIITSMNLVSGVGGIRNDDGWGEVLQRAVNANPTSELAASMGSKQSVKEVKTRQAVEKWKSKRAARGD